MPAGNYDIYAEQGATFQLFLRQRDSAGNPIDFAGANAKLDVKKTKSTPDLYLAISDAGVTGGGETGSWEPGSGFQGIAGFGGIALNQGSTGPSTGGIAITVDATTMSNVPSGSHFYDLKVIRGVTVDRIIQGKFVVDTEVTA